MGLGYILLWWIGVSCLFLILRTARGTQPDKRPVLIVSVVNLLLMGLIVPVSLELAGYVGALFWLTFTLAPGLLKKRVAKRALELELSGAVRDARLLSVLQPWGKGRRWAGDLARIRDARKRGTLSVILPALSGKQIDPMILQTYLSAIGYEADWPLLLQVAVSLPEREVEVAPLVLRALGEQGRLEEQREAFRRYFTQGHFPTTTRAAAAMLVLAFHGVPEILPRLFVGALSGLPKDVQEFWTATGYWARGENQIATPILKHLAESSDSPRTRKSAELRLGRAPTAIVSGLPPTESYIIDSIRPPRPQDFEQKTPLSRRAPATLTFMVLNIGIFILVEMTGGSTNQMNLFRWGMLLPEAVAEGQYWRLLAATFLHFGLLHLFMNMLALNFVGHFVEALVGSVRFALLYLFYGVSSMSIVTWLSLKGILAPQTLVGASGAVTGLIGLSTAIFLKAWLRDRSPRAFERLRDVFLAVLIQVAFDLSTKQVSFTAHMSGTVLGFLTGLLPIEKKSIRV